MADGTIHVHRNIDLSNRSLVKLPDLSEVICHGSFLCDGNRLKSLEGAPRIVGDAVDCRYNCMESYEGMPVSFRVLRTDSGSYYGPENVPADKCTSPETAKRIDQEVSQGTTRDITPIKPSRFRPPKGPSGR